MHDDLFKRPCYVARYRAGPHFESREAFLMKARADGYAPSGLKRTAWMLLIVAEAIHRHGGGISATRLEKILSQTVRVGHDARRLSKSTSGRMLRAGTDWLSSIGMLLPEPIPTLRFQSEREAYEQFMRVERGLSLLTIELRRMHMKLFFAELPTRVRSLEDVTVSHIDA